MCQNLIHTVGVAYDNLMKHT